MYLTVPPEFDLKFTVTVTAAVTFIFATALLSVPVPASKPPVESVHRSTTKSSSGFAVKVISVSFATMPSAGSAGTAVTVPWTLLVSVTLYACDLTSGLLFWFPCGQPAITTALINSTSARSSEVNVRFIVKLLYNNW